MAPKKHGAAAPKAKDVDETAEGEVATIPTETLQSLADIISRHPEEMLQVIRRYMEDDETS